MILIRTPLSGSRKVQRECENLSTSHLGHAINKRGTQKNSPDLERVAATQLKSDEFFCVPLLFIKIASILCLKRRETVASTVLASGVLENLICVLSEDRLNLETVKAVELYCRTNELSNRV